MATMVVYALEASRPATPQDAGLTTGDRAFCRDTMNIFEAADATTWVAKWGAAAQDFAYASLTGKPTLGTAAEKNIPASGDAAGTEVVYGTDTRLADARTPSAHGHAPGDVTGTAVVTADSRLSDARTPTAHATSHKSGGSDSVKLDELAAPTDVTMLNATTAAHGLMQKYPGGTTNFLRADGAFAAPPGGGGGPTTLKKTADQIINGTAFQNITDLTFEVAANTDYAFDFYITFRSTTATGFRFSVNGPAGVVDFMRKYQTVANSDLVGVATWLEGHAVAFDTMTVTTSTIAAGVDLHCRMTGRFKCGGSGGTFAARAASEAANNDLVVQKGSWGLVF